MKKLSEIKTGEKFEYEGRYYMGMVVPEAITAAVMAIDLETGLPNNIQWTPDTLVRPVELDMMVEAVKVLKYKEGDVLVLEHPATISIEATERLKKGMAEHYGLKALVFEDGTKLSAILRKAD